MFALRDEVSGAVYPGALGRAAGYIHGHFTGPALTLAETARHAGVTPGYLSALFRRTLGCTFTEYVTGKRIQLAKEIRKLGFRNEIFSSLEKVVDRLCDVICHLSSALIHSITGRDWIIAVFN